MSKLEHALALAKRGFRVFPLLPNSKVPAINDFPNAATCDETQIRKWFTTRDDRNIGISTDDFLVVDVDAKQAHKNGVKTIEALNRDGKHFPPTTQQKTATQGLHLIYTIEYPVKNSVSKLGPGLDIRGKGGYVVGCGSTIDGVAYTINDHVPERAPEWLIATVTLDRDRPIRVQEVAAVVDQDRAYARGKRYLEELPPHTAGERNNAGFKVAAELKDMGADQNTCLLLMLEEWKCEPMLDAKEVEHVVKSAFTYSENPQGSKSPEAQFAAPVEESGEEEALPDEGHPFDNLNREYAFITMGGKHRILFETTNEEGLFVAEFLEEQTFHKKLAARMHATADGRTVPLSKAWINSAVRREYRGLAFRPEAYCDPAYYNLWRGFGLEPLGIDDRVTDAMKRAVDAFEEHLFENVCDRNTEYFRWLMSWFAHMIQKPWEKPGTAVVLQGKKGVGKNVIFECFRPMFPDNYLVAGNRRYLTSNFNGHLEQLLMFVADEAFWSGDKASDGILKSLITDARINIERKGKDPFSINSCHRVVLLGNDAWVVPASEDERRFAVFQVGEGRKQDRRFFGQMAEDMKAGGARYLFTKLKAFHIGDSDVGRIPITPGLLKQKERTLDTNLHWWLDSLALGYVPHLAGFESSLWQELVTQEELKSSFVQYAKTQGRSAYLPDDTQFLQTLQNICPSVKVRRVLGAPVRVELPPLETAREEWDQYMGIKRKWD